MAKDDAMKTAKTVLIVATMIGLIAGWAYTYASSKGGIDKRVTVVETDMGYIKGDITDIKDTMKEISVEQKKLSDAVIKIEAKLP